MSLRAAAKTKLLGLSYRLRGPLLWDLLRGGRAKILMYHGVPSRDRFDGVTNYWGYNVPVAAFEHHLRYLKRHCHVVSLQDLLAGRDLSRSKTNVVLTFDDGYENNYTNAFRLLEQHRMPAVFALPTAFVVGRDPLWNDVVEYAVKRCAKTEVAIRWNGELHRFATREFPGALALYNWLMSQCVQSDPVRRTGLIAAALEEMEVPASAEELFADEDYRPLTPAQVERMARSDLVEFASHSVHHYMLARASRDEKRRELRESKRQVEEMTGLPCTLFCVPGGSYDDEVLAEAFDAGYERILTSDVGVADPSRRVLNRNGIFHHDRIHWFADTVHGPVDEVISASRRTRRALRRLLHPQRNP